MVSLKDLHSAIYREIRVFILINDDNTAFYSCGSVFILTLVLVLAQYQHDRTATLFLSSMFSIARLIVLNKLLPFWKWKKYTSKTHCEICLHLFLLAVTSILFIAYETFKRTEVHLKCFRNRRVTFQVSNKPSFKTHEKLKGVLSTYYCGK